MKKIAVIGLYSLLNMGDRILCETSQYLLKQIVPHVEIREVDVLPSSESEYQGLDRLKFKISQKMRKYAKKKFTYTDSGKFRYRYEYFMWWLRVNSHYKRKLAGVDAILFSGGGFLKFRTQGLNYYVEQIIKIAQRKNIPVMMSGMGIEGYDEKDVRCQKLKQTINSDCMKVITTRDDIDILQNCYIENPNIKTARVGDPAFWCPECYGIQKSPQNTKIGINLIRGRIFRDYGNTCSYTELKEFYKELILSAERRGMDWVLFSNGMKSDQKFGKKLLKELEMSPEDKLLPAPESSEDLLNMIKDFKCIFGARLHACITAYALDVPAVGFIWNEKTRFFADITDKKENFFEEAEMDAERILDQMETAMEKEYDTSIRDRMKGLTKQYMEEFFKELV